MKNLAKAKLKQKDLDGRKEAIQIIISKRKAFWKLLQLDSALMLLEEYFCKLEIGKKYSAEKLKSEIKYIEDFLSKPSHQHLCQMEEGDLIDGSVLSEEQAEKLHPFMMGRNISEENIANELEILEDEIEKEETEKKIL